MPTGWKTSTNCTGTSARKMQPKKQSSKKYGRSFGAKTTARAIRPCICLPFSLHFRYNNQPSTAAERSTISQFGRNCLSLYHIKSRKVMKDSEVDRFVKEMEAFGRELAKSKEKSLDFLVRAGIVTKKGKLTKPYKHLCIPQERG